jgi:hypothetical protein
MYSIYTLTDPRDMTIRYVGMSENACRRLAQHIQNRNKRRHTKDIWMEALLDAEILPIVQVIERVESKKEAEERERYWIEHHFSIGTPLTNMNFSPIVQQKTLLARKRKDAAKEAHKKQRAEQYAKTHLRPEEIPAHLERVKALITKAGWKTFERIPPGAQHMALYAYHSRQGEPSRPYMFYIASLPLLWKIDEEGINKKLGAIVF